MRSFHIRIRVPSARKLGAIAATALYTAADGARKRIHEALAPRKDSALEDIEITDFTDSTDFTDFADLTDAEPVTDADATDDGTVTAREALLLVQSTARRVKDTVAGFATEVKCDIDAICDRDPAARSRAEVLCLYSGLHALMLYRVSHALHESGHCFPARLVSQGAKFLTGIEIHPAATIGKGLFIDHGSGVVIGETAIVGDNCTLYQGVTLGGTGKDTGKRHPTLGDNVLVGAGAKLLGNFTIGDGAKIAAGAVVLRDVPENCTAVGIPARVVRCGGEKLARNDEMDQTHIPDPVAQQLARIEARLAHLERAGRDGGQENA